MWKEKARSLFDLNANFTWETKQSYPKLKFQFPFESKIERNHVVNEINVADRLAGHLAGQQFPVSFAVAYSGMAEL